VTHSFTRGRLRWRTCTPAELHTVSKRLAEWPCEAGGALRHMFALAAIEVAGAGTVRLASDDDRWAAAVVHPGRLVVPMGDADAILAAGPPTRRWRLMVADAAAADAVLAGSGQLDGSIVHHQRLMSLDPDALPDQAALPDPGLRLAKPADAERLADLAVRLHLDDQFGPDPGPAGRRGYLDRMATGIERGSVFCAGPVGQPWGKLERSVASWRWGVQLAGIVVDQSHRGRGLGQALVAAATRYSLREGPHRRPIALHVRAANTTAIRAYEAVGFRDREEWRLVVRS